MDELTEPGLVVNTLQRDVERVCALIEDRANGTSRTLIGIAGPPASDKSTLAQAVVDTLNMGLTGDIARAALLPMEGYHLDNRILQTRGLLARKGAPETFNGTGFCQAVQQLATTESESFHPTFDRQLDLAIANAIAISPATPLVVVEGNYLLLKSDPWRSLRQVFTASVFVSPPLDALRDRLHQRWIDHGLDSQAALARATQNDLPNAETVLQQSHPADLHLSQN